MTTVPPGCARKPNVDFIPAGKSVNYKVIIEADKNAVNNKDTIKKAMEYWYDTHYDENLNDSVIYTNDRTEAFANMVYYKSIALGCTSILCEDTSGANKHKIALACVYGDAPKLGEPLYIPAPKKNTQGCKSNKTCKTLVKDATCITASSQPPTYAGLCETKTALAIDSDTTTEAPTSSTESTTSKSETPSTSTEKPTTSAAEATTTKGEGMTQQLRDKVVSMHNRYRSMLARGLVRNGKEGNPNCPTAMNMYEMRYDTAMEAEAQAYANSCPMGGSPVSTRPYSGENYQSFYSIIITPDEAIANALENWWTQILKNGVNHQMKYNEYLAQKPLAPNAFTQMAWAESYKVGCGFNRCSFGTVVICRYSPRGNIYQQFIYKPGTVCASCSGSCKDALCPAPPY
ncbi:SCP-like protein [Ancylostoma caninum]|uniref:SCP-like protein n=1 Tax=Ancylostoma caninum TaxID=29170 RepID=A0A368GVD0_ANCCA|nr:SCP-like protein [Ancylostoma caninum]